MAASHPDDMVRLMSDNRKNHERQERQDRDALAADGWDSTARQKGARSKQEQVKDQDVRNHLTDGNDDGSEEISARKKMVGHCSCPTQTTELEAYLQPAEGPIIASEQSPDDPPPENPNDNGSGWKRHMKRFGAGAAVAGGIAFLALNVAVPAVGFTSIGIQAGSMAASWMSSAAIANGGGVAAGSAVAILQSIGATGVAASTCAGFGVAAGAAGTAAAAAAETVMRSGRLDVGTQTD